jgi:hypothetical protein
VADFNTFDLGRVIQTAESIKGMKRDAETDTLRNAYLNTQIAGAKQTQEVQAQQAAAQQQELSAKRQYYTAQAALSSADPKGTIEAIAPQFVQDFEAKHGQGSWQQLSSQQAHQAAQQIMQQAQSVIGPQAKVKYVDQGGQLVAIDENTGQPIQGLSPLAKSASPDSQLSAQTSTANAKLSAQTSRENNAASIATTTRGQDIQAETARRGQDLTAANNKATNASSPQNLSKAWDVYQQARSGLVKGLQGTETGPIAGRIPAVTTAQQVGEGAVAAMAPVLKQIFRVAGEGTFTDKDQELLMRMVPTRTDTPESRDAKLQNIDNIIRAKLGQGSSQSAGVVDFSALPP